jgi:hypothetical protein
MNNTAALNRYLTLFIVIIITLCSCAGTSGIVKEPYIVADSRQQQNLYYIPFVPNVPLLKAKNQLSAGLQLNASYENLSNSSVLDNYNFKYVNSKLYSTRRGGNLQAAYMPGKHIGVMASYSQGSSKSPDIDYAYGNSSSVDSFFTYQGQTHLKYNRFEIGAGYITAIDKYLHFETYAGYGFSKINNRLHTGRLNLKNNYLFLQPTIAYVVETKNKYTIQGVFVSKFIGNFSSITNTNFTKERELFTNAQAKLLKDKPFHVFWEPGIIFRFGWKNIIFHSGYSVSTNLTSHKLQTGKENLSIGVNIIFKTKK